MAKFVEVGIFVQSDESVLVEMLMHALDAFLQTECLHSCLHHFAAIPFEGALFVDFVQQLEEMKKVCERE